MFKIKATIHWGLICARCHAKTLNKHYLTLLITVIFYIGLTLLISERRELRFIYIHNFLACQVAAIKLKARFVYLQAHVLYCQVTLPLFFFLMKLFHFINAGRKGLPLTARAHPGAAGCRADQPWRPEVPETSHWQTPASGSRCCCELMSETVMNGFCQGNIVLEAQSSLLFLAVCALAQRSGDWTPQATKSQRCTPSTRLCQWPFGSHCLCQHLPTAQLSRRLC